MEDIKKLSGSPEDGWFVINTWGKDEITAKDLANILSVEDLSEIQKIQLAKKREQYEELKPAWFKHAPESATAKWEEYTNTDKLEKLQWIHDNVSYNADSTMNIIKLDKTFCEDISGQNKKFSWELAKELENTNTGWYKLMTDYNNCPSDKKEQTDWYKVINIFSNGNGDTVEGMELFRDMAWCNGRYWTPTAYKKSNWIEVSGVALFRKLDKYDCNSYWLNSSYFYRVCGFKDSMKVA